MTENQQAQQPGAAQPEQAQQSERAQQPEQSEQAQQPASGYQDGYRAGYQVGYGAAQQQPYATPYRRLTRSRPDSQAGAPISGVCGGLAQYLGLDPTLVRILVAIAMVVVFPVAPIVYVVMWAVVPQE